MRGSNLAYWMGEYVKDRNGRINWYSSVWLYLGREGRKKRAQRRTVGGGLIDFETKKDETGEYALFRCRGAKCHNVGLWTSILPIFTEDDRKPWTYVPSAQCKTCEFHEPAKQYGRLRYARCRWWRENSGMESPLQLLDNAFKEAKEILGV